MFFIYIDYNCQHFVAFALSHIFYIYVIYKNIYIVKSVHCQVVRGSTLIETAHPGQVP